MRDAEDIPSTPPSAEGSECPFLNRNDARCAPRFCVDALDSFFSLCCGSFRRCENYHRIRADDARAVASVGGVSEKHVALTTSATSSEPTSLDGRPLRIRAYLP